MPYKCIVEGCRTQPYFNLPDSGVCIGKWCRKHKPENAINVVDKKCSFEGCYTQPYYNFPGEKFGIRCNVHRESGMINVKSKKCLQEGCLKTACYAYIGESKKGIWCRDHIPNKAIACMRVNKKKCQFEGCIRIPSYNYKGEISALWCFDHRPQGTLNVRRKKCIFEMTCKNLAEYGFPNKKANYCHDHHDPILHINLFQENRCSTKECSSPYDFIIDGVKYCALHSPTKDFEIKMKKKCKWCDLEEKSTFVCDDCKAIQNKKEWTVVRHLRKSIDTPFHYNSNTVLNANGGEKCSSRRPDIFFDLPKHVLIVEVDEYQHRTYSEACECARLNEIVNSIGGKSVIIIRYNPDTIKHQNKTIRVLQRERLELLVKIVKEELCKEYDEFIVKLVQLYYNDNYEVYQPIKTEDITKQVCV